jgi:hypothetical protein
MRINTKRLITEKDKWRIVASNFSDLETILKSFNFEEFIRNGENPPDYSKFGPDSWFNLLEKHFGITKERADKIVDNFIKKMEENNAYTNR